MVCRYPSITEFRFLVGTALRIAIWALIAAAPLAAHAQMQRIRISDDGRGFVFAESGGRFAPWGFNYDHDADGRLLEDYWSKEWSSVEQDFREMKDLGANVVRIHLQFGKFMQGPNEPNAAALERLGKLLQLAESTGLYLDLTGLGCYHKADVPAWYDAFTEEERWRAQARFWEAVAERCAASPAVFCYDLMNEPVVPAGDKPGDDWLGPAFGGKHFVQRISLDRAGRERPQIARAWIEKLSAAIRKHDNEHLITVGLVDWSLERPGLQSGFVPEKIADLLDFVCVHIYPEQGKVDEALDTLRGFAAVGKPVVVEETFSLKCTAAELGQFMDRSHDLAAGWIGFYWGRTADEYRRSNQLVDQIMLQWLEFFKKRAEAKSSE